MHPEKKYVMKRPSGDKSDMKKIIYFVNSSFRLLFSIAKHKNKIRR